MSEGIQKAGDIFYERPHETKKFNSKLSSVQLNLMILEQFSVLKVKLDQSP